MYFTLREFYENLDGRYLEKSAKYDSPSTNFPIWSGQYICSTTTPTEPTVFNHNDWITSPWDFTAGKIPRTGKIYNTYSCSYTPAPSYGTQEILSYFPEQAVVAYMEVWSKEMAWAIYEKTSGQEIALRRYNEIRDDSDEETEDDSDEETEGDSDEETEDDKEFLKLLEEGKTLLLKYGWDDGPPSSTNLEEHPGSIEKQQTPTNPSSE
ncbi:hypothetical protein IWQ61_005414 [Dispira simplex]|nr:hypothetical protein IWQ61_005414 [Dispira simplex]